MTMEGRSGAGGCSGNETGDARDDRASPVSFSSADGGPSLVRRGFLTVIAVSGCVDPRSAPTGLAELAHLPQNCWGRLELLDLVQP